jgi:uncharacterized protein YkwD
MNRILFYAIAFVSCLLAVKAIAALPFQTRNAASSQPNQPFILAQSRFDAQLLQLTNAQRRQAGLPALRLSSQLGQAAQAHAQDMARNNIFSHTGSNGSSMVDRVKATGYSYSAIAENIAAGDPNPEATIRQWMNSPGHRRNILNRNYTEIGFGYVAAPNTRYRHYWVQVFGTPRNARQ